MSTLNDFFSSYTEYHQTAGNKLTHYLGIPLIVFSTLGLFATVVLPLALPFALPLSETDLLDLGLLVWLLSSVFYVRLDWKRGLPFIVLTFVLYCLSKTVMWQVHLTLFILGWILQGIGHYKYEKKSPAFLTNFSHLLIGPFWIFCRLLPF